MAAGVVAGLRQGRQALSVRPRKGQGAAGRGGLCRQPVVLGHGAAQRKLGDPDRRGDHPDAGPRGGHRDDRPGGRLCLQRQAAGGRLPGLHLVELLGARPAALPALLPFQDAAERLQLRQVLEPRVRRPAGSGRGRARPRQADRAAEAGQQHAAGRSTGLVLQLQQGGDGRAAVGARAQAELGRAGDPGLPGRLDRRHRARVAPAVWGRPTLPMSGAACRTPSADRRAPARHAGGSDGR